MTMKYSVLLHHLCALKSKDFTLKPKSKPKLKVKPKNCVSVVNVLELGEEFTEFLNLLLSK